MKKIPADVIKAAEAVADVHAEVDNWLGLREAVARAIMAERERCAAFAFAKYDWPPRWIAASFRGENSAYHDFEVPE